MHWRYRTGVPGCQQESEESTLAMADHAETVGLDALLSRQETECRRGLLLERSDSNGVGVGSERTSFVFPLPSLS